MEISLDHNLHVNEPMEEALLGTRSKDDLLNTLAEAVQELEAVRVRNHPNGAAARRRRRRQEETRRRSDDATLGPAGDEEGGRSTDEEQAERECMKSVLRALRELSVFHSERVAAWREVCLLHRSPPGGSDPQLCSTAEAESKITACADSFSHTLKSVGEDALIVLDKLRRITMKLDTEILQLCTREASTVNNPPNTHDHREPDFRVEDGGDPSRTRLGSDTEQTSDVTFSHDVEESGEQLEVECAVSSTEESVSLENHIDLQETEKDTGMENDKAKEETKNEWITGSHGVTGEVEDSQSHLLDACLIRAPAGVAKALRCEAADALSGLVVTGSEELVSRVIKVTVQQGANLHFPVTVAVPFRARYRSNYRDVAVKIVDEARRTSYVTPVIVEGVYGGQRGTLAEVRVYSLGLFAVVSCLKRESYTVPSRGLSLKLSTDARVSLNYLPGSFTASVMAQIMVQPVDAILLAAVRSRTDDYRSVVSTSPLLYLTHPTSQPLRRPLSVTLPCPTNTEKKKDTRGQREEKEPHHTSCARAAPPQDRPDSHRFVKSSKEMSSELLVVLGSKDQQWNVLEKVHVRNQQNGLVSFELTENFDRLLAVRLFSPLQPCHFASLAEELEESVCSHAVTIVLQRREDEPQGLLVAALPSRELGWEQNKLRAQGYSELLDTSSEISMCEGDQLLLRFSGNITSTGFSSGRHVQQVTFHSQRRNHLLVHLTEVDPFGNYSSPHYKGTVLFHKVARGQLVWRSGEAFPVNTARLDDPICKLSLTLPKKARQTNRPMTAKMKLCEETDSLSDSLLLWLSAELSEEDVALLVLTLRLRRSTAQLVKFRAGDNLSAQAFHLLAMWRRGLPAAPHQPKASQLAQCLSKSGRPDLATELLLRQAAATRQGSLQ